MKKVFLLLLAVCLIGTAALSAGCGQSGTSDGKSSGQKVLRVGMDASYPPFGSQNQETKDYEGFDVDISGPSVQRKALTSRSATVRLTA